MPGNINVIFLNFDIDDIYARKNNSGFVILDCLVEKRTKWEAPTITTLEELKEYFESRIGIVNLIICNEDNLPEEFIAYFDAQQRTQPIHTETGTSFVVVQCDTETLKDSAKCTRFVRDFEAGALNFEEIEPKTEFLCSIEKGLSDHAPERQSQSTYARSDPEYVPFVEPA